MKVSRIELYTRSNEKPASGFFVIYEALTHNVIISYSRLYIFSRMPTNVIDNYLFVHSFVIIILKFPRIAQFLKITRIYIIKFEVRVEIIPLL